MKYLNNLMILFIMMFCEVCIASEWRLHPSFDMTPIRIIDTPVSTYFLVHQQIYNKTYQGYDFPSMALFEYNKGSEEHKINFFDGSLEHISNGIRMVDYSSKGEYLIIIYNDGGIDIMTKDRSVLHIDRLKEYSYPGMSNVNSVVFEPISGDAWIATDCGYMHIDVDNQNLTKIEDCVLNVPLKAVCRIGKRLVAIFNDLAWEAIYDEQVGVDEFKKIESVKNPCVLLPLNENSFAYVEGLAGNSNFLMIANNVENDWVIDKFLDSKENFFSKSTNESWVTRYESNFIPNREGYLLYTSSKVFQIRAFENEEEPTIVSVKLDETPVVIGSWDFKTFWKYQDRGKFSLCEVTYDNNSDTSTPQWNNIIEAIRPNAPAAFLSTYMTFSPKYGHLVINHGQDWQLSNNSPVTPSLLSGLLGNEWTIHSQTYNMPESVEDNDALQRIYRSNINRFPIADPQGLILDPFYPDWIVCGSMFGGVMFQNISDIKKDVIKFAAENDLFKDFPGFVSETPVQTWGTMSCFSNPTIDNEGTIWILFSNPFEKNGSSPKSQLKYMTLSQRAKLYDNPISEITAGEYWKSITISNDDYPSWDCKVIAGRHIRNKNLIYCFTAGVYSSIMILNHKGTLDNILDDEIITYSHLTDKYGKKIYIERMADAVEDPLTGDILISGLYGLFVIHPETDTHGDGIYGEDYQSFNNVISDVLPVKSQVNKVIFDDGGRMWIGTNNTGVICVSADRNNIEAHYSTLNSPIPSDCVYGLGWNPESRSLMISTKLGLAEVFPDINSVGKTNNDAYVVPQSVIPGYNGYVEIRNITRNQPVRILDSTDNEIRTFSGNASNHIEWDLKDKSGTRVPAGKYYIVIGNGTPLELIVMSE